MPNVLLDFRVKHAGVVRYGSSLLAGLRALENSPSLTVLDRGRGATTWLRTPFTPWGRAAVAREAKRQKSQMVHGLHFEVPKVDLPTVVTIQDLIPLDYPASMKNPIRRRIYSAIIEHSIESSARLIVPSEVTASALRRRGAPSEKISIIPHGVDPRFTCLSPDERVKARRRFNGGRPYIATSVRSKPHKNIDGLDVAAAALKGTTGVPTLVSGWMEPRQHPNLRWVGVLTDQDLRMFYGGAEAFVLASHIEGFGLPALEALACGTPVVCGPNIGALPYIRQGVLAADSSDPKDIAPAVEKVLLDEALRDGLAAKGKQVAERLSAHRMAEATVALYQEVLRP